MPVYYEFIISAQGLVEEKIKAIQDLSNKVKIFG